MADIGEVDLFRFTSVAAVTDEPTAPVVGGHALPRYDAPTQFHAQLAGMQRPQALAAATAFLPGAIATTDAALAPILAQYAAARAAPNLGVWLGAPNANAINDPTFVRLIDAYLAHRVVGSAELLVRPYANLLRFVALMDRRGLVRIPAGAQNSPRRYRRLLASIPLVLAADLAAQLPGAAGAPAPAANPAQPAANAPAQPAANANPPSAAQIRQALQDIQNKEFERGPARRLEPAGSAREPGLIEVLAARLVGKGASPARGQVQGPAQRPTPQELQVSPATTATLNRLGINAAASADVAISLLEREWSNKRAPRRDRRPPNNYTMLGNVALPRFHMPERPLGAPQPAAGAPGQLLAGLPPQHPVVRFGELHVVRMQLVGYELGKFSHVENVLTGEQRFREHRTRRVVEEQTRLLTVQQEERESDLQKTDKSSMQSEMARSTSTQLNAEAGMTVSGNYGPSTEYSAQASVGLAVATETSSRTSSTVAREVTERTVQRVRERREEEIIRRRLQEDEEINRHGFQGPPDRHIRGIYRWINEIHRAQVYCLGERYYVELIVPEPAANFLRLVAQGLISGEPLPPKPDSIELDAASEEWDEHWGELGERYRVNVPPPPPVTQWVSATVSGTPDSAENFRFCHAEKIVIPAGYEASTGEVAMSKRENNSDRYWVTVYLGGVYFRSDANTDYPGIGVPMRNQRGEMTFSVNARDCKSLTVIAEVKCTVTHERMMEWRAEAYDAVLQGFRSQQIAYDEALRAANERAQQRAEEAQGRPRRIDVEKTIREETQRAFLSVLLGQEVLGFDTLAPQQINDGQTVYWRYDPARVAQAGPRIAFLQQAFEWRNMTVVFYPYFWGGQNRWQRSFDGSGGAEPAFTEFLSAGAARVQVPIRPEMAASLARELELEGIDLALPSSGRVDILEERLEAADHPDAAEAVGDPWELTLPTDLVIVERENNNLPFRDPLALAANQQAAGNGVVMIPAAQPAPAPQVAVPPPAPALPAAGAGPAAGGPQPEPAAPL